MLGAAVSVSAGAAWAVSVRSGKAVYSAPILRILGENAAASGRKKTGVCGLTEGRGNFLVLLDVLTYVGHEPW